MTAAASGILFLACPRPDSLDLTLPIYLGTACRPGLGIVSRAAADAAAPRPGLEADRKGGRGGRPGCRWAISPCRTGPVEPNLDGLSASIVGMVTRLQELVGTIRHHSHDAASMAQEIAASTQQMTASTQEVASTTGDLTERANQQALVVRAAAEDAGKILEIAHELAAGAAQAAERNAALARLARSHRERLDQSTAELARLAEEIERGATEAEALATASGAHREVHHPGQGHRQADPHAGAQRLDRGGPGR